MKKRLVSILLFILLTIFTVQGIAEIALPIVEEPITLRIAVARHSSDAMENFNDKFIFAKAQEETNIQIEWIPITEGNEENVAVLLAGDLPDVFIGLLSDSQIADNTSLFVPLEEQIAQLCPDIISTYAEHVEGWEDFLTYPDGHIYGLMGNYLFSPSNSIAGTMWINKVWLENLNLEVPTNIAELREVLIAFRDNDADGDGDVSNEIPLDFCQKHYSATTNELKYSFGIPGSYDIVDGKVIPTVNTEDYRAFLEYYHALCSEGLANIEGLSQTEEQYFANLSNMKVGAFWGWAPYTFISDPVLQEQYVCVGPLSAEGYTFRVAPNNLTANRNCFVVTKECKNVDAALQWWNYLSKDLLTATSARSGPEGLTWYIKDGEVYSRAYTKEDAIEYGYESLASQAGTSTFAASMGLTNCPPLIVQSPIPELGTTAFVRKEAVVLYEPYFTEQVMSKAIVPTENQEEFDFTCENIDQYIEAFASESILNGVTDESWNAYVAQLTQLNYDFYIQWYQDYFDGAF
ncbi:MAG: extracellular solute-binding protein [Clostridiales bacterium]|nr:extracellular solute-binding protein [Clostridiales bacterium]